ncbi:class I adenylate-forming enzyme family protein [Nocardia fusca]|uniref:class I adenylate-forming enzyme family protein n=1 Tax=Nocardia fusca TaxID=941183 RepID=UPI0007A76651|nr:AMP-binding protein [Nocardia fusca]
MNIAMLVDIAAETGGDRVVLGDPEDGTTYAQLRDRVRRAGGFLARRRVGTVVMIGVNSELLPIALFGSAVAGCSFSPLNYRWSDAGLLAAVRRLTPAVVLVDDDMMPRFESLLGEDGVELIARSRFLAEVVTAEPVEATGEPECPAVLLFTSGTSGTPKVAVLTHHNLSSYIFGSVELMSAGEGDAQLSCLPPYHVGGIVNLLSTLFSGRRIVQLPAFDPRTWIDTVRSLKVTHATVVPTMVSRIVELLAVDGGGLPSLRNLSYGGGRMPRPVLERVMALLPETGFVNGYGLTETSSTITVLGPEDHRLAQTSEDPAVRARLGSVGRALPTVELSVRDPDGRPVPEGTTGELWVRGEQVSGRYVDNDLPGDDGWFHTNDAAWMDAEGYVFVEGRLDDVIVRGGENISPGEVEDVLLDHPEVADAGVIGLPDDDWGERVVAAVVPVQGRTPDPASLQDWVRERLRSSKTPSTIALVDCLPYNDNGKLMRRSLKSGLAETADS